MAVYMREVNMLFEASKMKELLEICGTVRYIHMDVEIPTDNGWEGPGTDVLCQRGELFQEFSRNRTRWSMNITFIHQSAWQGTCMHSKEVNACLMAWSNTATRLSSILL